jgi:hypothetical protein
MQFNQGESTMTQHDERHGSQYDRGRADFWYNRPVDPHYYAYHADGLGRTKVTDLTPKERKAYLAGYEDAESDGGQKDWI